MPPTRPKTPKRPTKARAKSVKPAPRRRKRTPKPVALAPMATIDLASIEGIRALLVHAAQGVQRGTTGTQQAYAISALARVAMELLAIERNPLRKPGAGEYGQKPQLVPPTLGAVVGASA